MKVFFENLGTNVVNIPESSTWRIWTEIDEHEESCIKLEVDSRVYEVCNCWEFLQGNENLCPYTILEFYNATVKKVYEMLESDSVGFLNLEKAKEEVLPPFWMQWKERGWVRYTAWDQTEIV